jgi:predicted nucleotidyltransferase
LVDLEPGRDLLDLAGFKVDLEEALGCKVDVVTEKSLSPYLRERILAEARPFSRNGRTSTRRIARQSILPIP